MTAIYLEQSAAGHTMAFAPEIPGTYGWGPDLREALEVLQEDIEWKSKWLSTHGLKFNPDLSLQIIETVPAAGTASDYDTEAFFSWDALAYTNQELNQTRQIITESRSELLAMLKGLPRSLWNLRLYEGKRTVTEVIQHIAIAEWWYTTRVHGLNPLRESWRDYPADPLEKLISVRTEVLPFLDGMAAEDKQKRSRQVTAKGETWTGRKILRRMTWHELHHYKHLLKYIGQLT